MKDLEFFVLGSGSFAPGPIGTAGRRPVQGSTRNPAGYALRRGDEILLFDFGFGNLRQLVRAGLDPEQVSHVFFSHRHPDHVGDLPALLFYYRYDGKPRRRKLRIYGPRGFKNFVRYLTKAHHPWLKPRGFSLTVEELEEPAVVKGTDWRVHCREVPHTTEALAFRYESAAGSVCYTGDTSFDAGLAAFASGCGLFVLECSLADEERVAGHMRVRESLALARMARARRVLFSHLSPTSDRALTRPLSKFRSGRKAQDLMRIVVERSVSRLQGACPPWPPPRPRPRV